MTNVEYSRRQILGMARDGAVAAFLQPKVNIPSVEHHTSTSEGTVVQAVDRGFEVGKKYTVNTLRRVGFDIDSRLGMLTLGEELWSLLNDESKDPQQRIRDVYTFFDTRLAVGDEGEYDRTELISGFIGTAASIATIVDMTKRGRAGFRDYALMIGVSGAGALATGEAGKEKFIHNAEDTLHALTSIEGAVLGSKLIQLKGYVPTGLSEREMEDLSSRIGAQSKSETLRQLVYTANILGPLFTTFASSGVLRPLIHELARDGSKLDPENEDVRFHIHETLSTHGGKEDIDHQVITKFIEDLNTINGGVLEFHQPETQTFIESFLREQGAMISRQDDMFSRLMERLTEAKVDTLNPAIISATQGWIANNLGLYGIQMDIPLYGRTLGGGLGPRQAISTLKGSEFLSAIDRQVLPYHLASNTMFVTEVLRALPPEERADVAEIVRGYLFPPDIVRTLINATRRGISFRGKEILLSATEESKDVIPLFTQHIHHLTHAIRDHGMNPKELYARLTHLDADVYETTGDIAGEDIADIAYVLTLQSLAIPQMETTLGWTLSKLKDVFPQSEGGEYLIDMSTYGLIALMSSTYDNYVAQNIAGRIIDKRLARHVSDGKKGEYSRGVVKENKVDGQRLQALRMYYWLNSYISAQYGGGFLPPGNMANIAQASLEQYSITDATHPARLRSRAIPTALSAVALVTAHATGMLSGLPDHEEDRKLAA